MSQIEKFNVWLLKAQHCTKHLYFSQYNNVNTKNNKDYISVTIFPTAAILKQHWGWDNIVTAKLATNHKCCQAGIFITAPNLTTSFLPVVC